MQHCSLSKEKCAFSRMTFLQGRKRFSSKSTLLPSSSSRCEENAFDQSEKMVNFFLESDPTAQECDVADISDDCVIITNVEVVIETTEPDKTNNKTNSD